MVELQKTLIYLSESSTIVSMARINDVVELLNTLLVSYVNTPIMVEKSTLTHIWNCIQDSQGTI